MHRPLRQGKPWAFHGLEGVSDAAYEETDGQCVSHQLARHIRIKGKDAPWTQHQVAEMLVHATEALYEDDDENDPYDGGDASKIGFTAAAVVQLCRDLGAPVHIKWGGSKIESYTPEHSQYEAVAMYIWGDHCFCVAPATARAIAREQVATPSAQPNEVLATLGRRANSTPASQFWETYSKVAPGNRNQKILFKHLHYGSIRGENRSNLAAKTAIAERIPARTDEPGEDDGRVFAGCRIARPRFHHRPWSMHDR